MSNANVDRFQRGALFGQPGELFGGYFDADIQAYENWQLLALRNEINHELRRRKREAVRANRG